MQLKRRPACAERRLVADAGEDVVERAIGRLGEADAVGGDDRHVERGGEIAQRVVVRLLVAQQVALQLEIGVGAPEDADEPIDQPADAEPRAAQHRAAAERDEPAGVAVDLVERQRPFPFRRPQLHHRQQPAEIAVALLRFDEDGKTEDGVRDARMRGRAAARGVPHRRVTRSHASAPRR